MSYRINIKNQVYDLKDGFTIKEEFNETLDSGTVQLYTYGQELNKEPFDKAIVFNSDENVMVARYFEVDSIMDEIYSFGDTLEASDHFYTITLFSETKELERITLPSCSVTQPLDNSPRITVWDSINRFCSEYLPKIKVVSGNSFEYASCMFIDPRVRAKFENEECPEFQWDNPTLREVLNDLMSTKDCIVVVKNNMISYYDLTEKGNPIDISKLSRMTSNFSSSDYVSELTMYMKNGIGKKATKSMRYQSCKTTDESGEITTDNMAITTQKPIYSVKKLILYFLEPRVGGTRVHKIDVASRVLEYEDFRTRSKIYVSNQAGSAYRRLPYWTDAVGCSLPNHQVNFLYYKRGGFSIENIAKKYQGSRTFCFLNSAYLNMSYTIRYFDSDEAEGFASDLINSARKIFYEIEYETLYEQAMHFGKNLPTGHPENRVFDNQSNSYIDIQHQSIFEYAKVNRLSNQVKEIYGEYESESEVPALGDYIGDYILFSREISYSDSKIGLKGFLTKNYILKDYYTGVKSKKRSWQISSQNEALTKHEIIKTYVEASFSRKTDKLDLFYGGYDNPLNKTHYYSLICDLTYIKYQGVDKTLNSIRFQSEISNEYFPESGKAIALDCSIDVLGNSLCWTFGFEDNYKGSDYAEKEDDLYVQNFYPYADEKGNFNTVYIDIVYDIPDELYDENDEPFTLPTSWEDGGEDTVITSSTRDALESQRNQKPLCSKTALGSSTGVYGFTLKLDHKKDTREIFKATIQFEYCSDTNDIIIKPKFLEYVKAFNRNNEDNNLRLYISNSPNEKYDLHDTTPKGTAYPISNLVMMTFSGVYQSIQVTQNVETWNNVKSWCVANTNGEILFAVNKNSSFWFNLLASRDTNIYTDVQHRTIVGNIKED